MFHCPNKYNIAKIYKKCLSREFYSKGYVDCFLSDDEEVVKSTHEKGL